MSDAARPLRGTLHSDDGDVRPARFYIAADEPAPQYRERINPEEYATWVEDDGAIGIRRGTSVTIGATPQYAAKYDAIDWEN